jgi:hypothetical protein
MMKAKMAALVAVVALATTGCATHQKTGTLVGAVVGAAVAGPIGGVAAAHIGAGLVGGAIGASVGSSVGKHMDQKPTTFTVVKHTTVVKEVPATSTTVAAPVAPATQPTVVTKKVRE